MTSRKMHRLGRILAVFLVLVVWGSAALAKPGYYRYPDIHGDLVVFTAEGDLWTARLDGTDIRRLTSHVGDEAMARFSPDGQLIAFVGYYDGNSDVYVIPTTGGEPRRLTWHPASDVPIGWTPDGRIIFRSYRDHPNRSWELFTVSPEGGEPEKIPIGRAVYLDIDPETGMYAFTRTAGGGTWKRYRGGTAPDIWVGHPDRQDYHTITDFDGTDSFPMWYGGRIYFVSDQGGTYNLWSMAPDGSDRRMETKFETWDVRWPAMGPSGRIVFMLGADIHLFDPNDGSERLIPLDLPSERVLTRVRYPKPSKYFTGFALAPEGDRVAIVTRGEIFSIAAKEGVTLPITQGSGAREGRVSFDPEGKRVVYVTDESGEEEIATADAWGRGDVKKLPSAEGTRWHFRPVWSPDGKWIAYADQSHTLYVVSVDDGKVVKVDHSPQREIGQYAWSPDGRWLAYAKSNRVDFSSIFIYDTKEKETHQITPWTTDDHTPAWDPEGRYLYFLSNRYMNPVLGWLDFETVVVKPTKLYMVLLRPDVENPLAEIEGLPPKDEEEEEKDEEKEEEKEDKEKKEEELKPVEIDFEGIEDRFVELPVEAGRYHGLAATKDKIFFGSSPVTGMAEEPRHGEEGGPRAALLYFDLKKKEKKTFLRGVSAFDLQPKSGKIAVMKRRGEIYVLDAGSPPGDDLSEKRVSLSDVVIELDPREEWRQIFYEGWRQMRDFYWDESMSGVDWEAVRDQYAALLPRVATREDLRDLMAEMIGELATSHTYIWGGDPGRDVPSRSNGLLGAVLEREGDAFRVVRIYRGDPADRVRSPLLEPEVNVKEGDYILAVNRKPVPPDLPFEASLENLAGKKVVLTVNDRPDPEGARDVVVEPLGLWENQRLIYVDWVRRNREYVAQKTGGKIGYIHIPDMSTRGLVAFDTWFYPQLDKEGMVVDVRWNGGGFVSQLILARFLRHVISWDRARWGAVTTYPYRVLNGPFVVITNEHAGSDGDIFPAAVQLTGIAPVIGKRSWGGVIGIRVSRRLVDGGILTEPEFAWWDEQRGWRLENRGVEPDIEVENLPQDIARGIDAQLDRAIEEVLKLREERPPKRPEFGPAPRKDREAFKDEL
jgi:tricorn protease